MEKYIIVLIILSMLLFCICTFPIISHNEAQMYLVIQKETVADKLLVLSQKWQTKDYFVYKIDKEEENIAKVIPNGKIIKEYVCKNHHNLNKGNPFMQVILSGENYILGLPYVID